jgi:hypothetical protein
MLPVVAMEVVGETLKRRAGRGVVEVKEQVTGSNLSAPGSVQVRRTRRNDSLRFHATGRRERHDAHDLLN